MFQPVIYKSSFRTVAMNSSASMEKSLYVNRIARNLQKDGLHSKIGLDKMEFYHIDKLELKQILSMILKVFQSMEIEDEKLNVHDEFSMEESVGFVVEKTTQVAGKDASFQPALTTIQDCLTREENREILLVLLDYLLERYDYLAERALLSKFLAYPPPEPQYLADEDVANSWENYRTLQQIFKQSHTDYKNALKQKGERDLEEVRQDFEKMKAEIENLQQKVSSNKSKMAASDPESSKYFTQVIAIQQLKEESEALQREYETRKHQFDVAEVRHEYETKHLEQLQRSEAPDPQDLMMNILAEYRHKSEMKAEVEKEEAELEQKLSVLETSERQPGEWTRVINMWKIPSNILQEVGPIEDTNGLNALAELLQSDIRNLTQTALDLESDPESLKARNVIQKQIGNMDKQLQSVEEEVRAEEERNGELLQANSHFEHQIKDLEHLFSQDTMKFKDDLKEEIKRSLEQHKKLTKEYDALRAHRVDIDRTKILLETELHAVTKQLQEEEQKMGVSGFSQTQGQLEKVSTLKSEIDERKGQTLVDYSNVVEDLREKINEKRSEIEEPLKQVKALRNEVRELKTVHGDLKAKYDAVKSSYETQRNDLERNVTALRGEMTGYETRMFQLQNQIDKLTFDDEQVKKELKAYTSSDPIVKKNTLREMYNSKMNEQANLGKQLRARKKDVMENEDKLRQQKTQWERIDALMQLKLQSLSKRKSEIAQAHAELHADEERLVIG
ncbi:intraflagellar transport protein 81 homolog [Convolutriloba macropyga]|uniref:intraflagellar transport protein 81 homolog n=1 Tax=Convolutriloba macropyga TaxID=536237 RepID=UPI003F52768B